MLPAARAGLFVDPDLHPAVLRTAGVGIVAGDGGHVGEGQQALSRHAYAQTLELLPDPLRARRRQARVELPAAVGVCKSCDVVASPGHGRRLQIAGKARPYLSAYPSGRHVARAQAEIAKARCTPPASAILNGVYLARTQPGCDAGQRSVRVAVQDGRVSWQHDARGTTFQWEGTIEKDGELRASVRGVDSMQARGRWNETDRLIEMAYPQCGMVAITIYQMLRR